VHTMGAEIRCQTQHGRNRKSMPCRVAPPREKSRVFSQGEHSTPPTSFHTLRLCGLVWLVERLPWEERGIFSGELTAAPG